MKFFLSLLAAVFLIGSVVAQDCGGAAPNPGSGPQPLKARAGTFQSFPAASFVPAPAVTPAPARLSSQEELDFLANGPKLFPMDVALKVSAKTGKPVVCWMGPHIFASAKARAASEALGDTTIQAVMDTDGETVGIDGKAIPVHRVKFSSGNYAPTAKVGYIPVAKLTEESPAKILAFARGASQR